MADNFKIDVNKTVTSRLNIQPEKLPTGGYKYDGLCPVRFVGCTITTQTFEKGQFAGLTSKVLNFEFINYKLNTSDPDRYLTHQEKVIGSQEKSGDDYVDMEKKRVEGFISNMWGRIKHILDSCKGLGNYRDIAQDKNLLKLIEFPIGGDPNKIVAAYDAFYQFVCDFVNGDGKTTFPIYLNKDGQGVPLWAKLLPAYPDYKWYAFPGFVGQGFLEKMNFGSDGKTPVLAKVIQIKGGESLELASAKRQPNAPGISVTPGAVPSDVASILGIQ